MTKDARIVLPGRLSLATILPFSVPRDAELDDAPAVAWRAIAQPPLDPEISG